MKKYILVAFFTSLLATNNGFAQTRGIKIGYIDMEYILEKVPDYAEAKNQLDLKAEKWKKEIEVKKTDIAKLKEALKMERVLLTKELTEEREEEIAFQENELLEYEQKKFGPGGELIVQKAVLVKPIQDRVFNAVQDIAEAKKYDYIFDKSSDLTMLFAAKKHDISERIVQTITRSDKRQQMSKKQQQLEEERERKQDLIDDNPNLTERQKQIEQRAADRLKAIEEKKILAEEKKAEADAKRKQAIEEKNAKKSGTISDKSKPDANAKTDVSGQEAKTAGESNTSEEKKAAAAEAVKKTLEERQKVIEDRKKAAEEKRLKILADREAAKKAKEDEKKAKEAEKTTKP